jgi:hypothetical protein
MTATVIQGKCSVTAQSQAAVIFGVAPTSGSILVAIVTRRTTVDPAADTGWTFDGNVWKSLGSWGRTDILYKTCGAGESTTQTPITSATDTDYDTCVMYEVGTPGGIWTDIHIDNYDGNGLYVSQGIYDANPIAYTAPAGKDLLLLGAVGVIDRSFVSDPTNGPEIPTISGDYSSVITSVSAGSPIFRSSVGRYTSISASASAAMAITLDTIPEYIYAAQVVLQADLGGGGGGATPVTATILGSAGVPSGFRYTTLKVT